VEVGTDENGNEVSVITTAEYDENGNISGYTVSAKTSEESEDSKSAVVETTTTETEDSWRLIEGEDGLYYLVSASMSNITAGENNDVVNVQTVQPTQAEAYVSNGWNNNVMLGRFLNNDDVSVKEDAFDQYEFVYVGTLTGSAVLPNFTDGSLSSVEMFKLVDSEGQYSYAYCADLSTVAVSGAGYNIENVEDASYYDADAAAHIKAIAENGYWGTSEGTGSLDRVKLFLRNNTNLSTNVINTLTPGIAMTATQAALWQFGNSSTEKQIDASDPASVYMYYSPFSGFFSMSGLNAAQRTCMDALYNALVNMNPSDIEDASSTIISQGKFAPSASIILKGQDESNPSIFKTDITFTLEMVPSDQDDLVVIVRDDEGEIVTVRRLAGALKEGETMASASQMESGMLYTLEDIPLTDGVSVSLNLSGVQDLALGAYLYTADVYSDSQTFVGLASGKKNVDLSVQLDFNVSAPKVLVEHNSSVTVTKTAKELSLISEEIESEEEGQEESYAGSQTPEEEEPVEEVEETVEKAAKIVEEVEDGQEEKTERPSKTSSSKADTAVETDLGWAWIFMALSFAGVLKLLAVKRQ
jgi:hypothetical protein